MTLVRVYCGLASADQEARPNRAEATLVAAIVDDAGRLLEVSEIADAPAGYARLATMLVERSSGPSGATVAADRADHVVTALLTAAGSPLAIVHSDVLDDYAERFADDESAAEVQSPTTVRRAVGLARALQAGAISAFTLPIPPDLAAHRPVLGAHAALAHGRKAAAAALREVLRELYPAALRAFPDPAEPVILAVLDALPEAGMMAGEGRGRAGGLDPNAVITHLAQDRIAGEETLRQAVTALRVAVAETPRRSGTSRAVTSAVADAVRQAVSAVRACDAGCDALVATLAPRGAAAVENREPADRRRVEVETASVTPLRRADGQASPAGQPRSARVMPAARPEPDLAMPDPQPRPGRGTPDTHPGPARSVPQPVIAGRRARQEPMAGTSASAEPRPLTMPPVAPRPTGARQPSRDNDLQPPDASRWRRPSAAAPAVTAGGDAPEAAASAAAPTAAATARNSQTPAAPAPPAPDSDSGRAARMPIALPAGRPEPPSPESGPRRRATAPAPPAAAPSAPPAYQAAPVVRPVSAAAQGTPPPAAEERSHSRAEQRWRAADVPQESQSAGRAGSQPAARPVSVPPPPPPGITPLVPAQRGRRAAESDEAVRPASANDRAGSERPKPAPAPNRSRSAREPAPVNGFSATDHSIPVPAPRPAADAPPPGARENWPLVSPSDDRESGPGIPQGRSTSPDLEVRAESRSHSRIKPPWLADDLPPEPPMLRLVEPPPLPDPALGMEWAQPVGETFVDPAPRPADDRPSSAALEHRPARNIRPRSAPPVADEGDGDLLIFAEIRSAWFLGDSAASDPDWSSLDDSGWQAAEQAAKPAVGVETGAGLPRRVPQANLVPGSPLREERPLRIVRDPESIAAHTTGYFRGYRRGQEIGGYAVGGRPGRQAAGGWDFGREQADADEPMEREYRSAAYRF